MNSKRFRVDVIWVCALLLWVLILAIPFTRDKFEEFTANFRYTSSFIKFAILATMGELLGLRIVKGEWGRPAALPARVIIWGFAGMAVSLAFTVYNSGVIAAQAAGALPLSGSALAAAFFTSLIMNLTFGPMLFVTHKFSDLFLDMRFAAKKPASLSNLLAIFDWGTMVRFTWIKCCLIFWIPAHTVVFMLPSNFRIIASAFLSIALGLIGALTKRKAK